MRKNNCRVKMHNFQTSVLLTKVLGLKRITGFRIRWSTGATALAGVLALCRIICGCDSMYLRGWHINTFILFGPVKFLQV